MILIGAITYMSDFEVLKGFHDNLNKLMDLLLSLKFWWVLWWFCLCEGYPIIILWLIDYKMGVYGW